MLERGCQLVHREHEAAVNRLRSRDSLDAAVHLLFVARVRTAAWPLGTTALGVNGISILSSHSPLARYHFHILDLLVLQIRFRCRVAEVVSQAECPVPQTLWLPSSQGHFCVDAPARRESDTWLQLS